MDSLLDDARAQIAKLSKRASNSWTITLLERLIARVESHEAPEAPEPAPEPSLPDMGWPDEEDV